MATEALLLRKGKWLTAADPSTETLISSLKDGEVVGATIRRTRNPQHHRLFFALLNVVFENQNRYATVEQLLDAVKIGTGHYDTYEVGGRTVLRLRSIAFAKMDQTAFNQFYDKVVELIVTKILPNTDKAELNARVLEMIA